MSSPEPPAVREMRCHCYRGVHIPGCWGCVIYGHSRCTCERGPRLDAATGACEECVTPKRHWNYCPRCGRVLTRGR